MVQFTFATALPKKKGRCQNDSLRLSSPPADRDSMLTGLSEMTGLRNRGKKQIEFSPKKEQANEKKGKSFGP